MIADINMIIQICRTVDVGYQSNDEVINVDGNS